MNDHIERMREGGRRGGASVSRAKREAVRQNGLKGGRPPNGELTINSRGDTWVSIGGKPLGGFQAGWVGSVYRVEHGGRVWVSPRIPDEAPGKYPLTYVRKSDQATKAERGPVPPVVRKPMERQLGKSEFVHATAKTAWPWVREKDLFFAEQDAGRRPENICGEIRDKVAAEFGEAAAADYWDFVERGGARDPRIGLDVWAVVVRHRLGEDV